ncbi:MAG TPA: baseplate J/gp47 family protein, partial [Thermodesulfobacteriota bacterium]
MAFQRPTLETLLARIEADLTSRLPGADTRLRRSNLAVLARVHAGAVHGLYGYLAFLARQLFPDQAEAEYLQRWATIWGVTRTPAAAAVGAVTLTGTDWAVVPAGTRLQRGDGVEYTVDADVIIQAGTATAAVTAVEPGAAGNADAGVVLTFVSPIVGVQGTAPVAAGGLTGGADEESDASLRERLLARIQEPPHGGSAADYVAWAREVAGVTRVWVFPEWMGAGTVGVTFVRDDDADGLIPSAAEVQAVADYLAPRRPVTADVVVFAPIPVALDLTIAIEPDTQA